MQKPEGFKKSQNKRTSREESNAAMGDTYHRYDAPAEIATSFPGSFSSEAPTLLCNNGSESADRVATSPNFVERDRTPLKSTAYDLADRSVDVHPESGRDVGEAGFSRQDVAPATSSGALALVTEMPNSSRNVDGSSLPPGVSNILFVGGLPTDCTRREVGHIFRPFIGYRDIKVVHKEAMRPGEKARVLCFVEFAEPECALTALEALQGYKFDDKRPDLPPLRIHFAHFPFRVPLDHDEQLDRHSG